MFQFFPVLLPYGLQYTQPKPSVIPILPSIHGPNIIPIPPVYPSTAPVLPPFSQYGAAQLQYNLHSSSISHHNPGMIPSFQYTPLQSLYNPCSPSIAQSSTSMAPFSPVYPIMAPV